MNYEVDIKIDETALDVEWLEQPTLLLKYTKNAAMRRKILDETKEALDIVKAGVDKKIRTNPDKYGIDKITENAINNAILSNYDFQEANKLYIEAKYEVDIAQSAVNAIYQRKEALENLVKLHGMQYFAGPTMPRDLSNERKYRQEKQSQINVSMTRKLNKKSINN
jgi:hypothetical protein